MKITDIKSQIKNKERMNIYLDNQYYCSLDLYTIMKYRVKEGQEISREELIKIQKEAEFEKGFNYSLSYISRSVKTAKQMKRKLVEKGYIEEIIVEIIEKLKELSLIDDRDYCKRYIETYKKKKGERLLRRELKLKGVSETIIDDELKELDRDEDIVVQIARKYMKNKEFSLQNKRKCINHIVLKGFSYDEALKAYNLIEGE